MGIACSSQLQVLCWWLRMTCTLNRTCLAPSSSYALINSFAGVLAERPDFTSLDTALLALCRALGLCCREATAGAAQNRPLKGSRLGAGRVLTCAYVGVPRRKKKAVHKAATTDDKRLQSTLKRLGVNTIPGIEEVNLFQGNDVVHFLNPKGARLHLVHTRRSPACLHAPGRAERRTAVPAGAVQLTSCADTGKNNSSLGVAARLGLSFAVGAAAQPAGIGN